MKKSRFSIDLVNGQVARVRRTRLYYPTPQVGEWQDEPLFVQKHNGVITILSVPDFAEFDPRGYDYNGVNEHGHHVFVAEDYQLELDI